MAARGQWIAAGVIVGALATALVAAMALSPDLFPVTVGSTAPQFQAIDLATGDTVTLDRYKGKVTLLNVWATWCLPCEEEMPSMQRLHQELGPSGLEIVSISIDPEDPETVTDWMTKRALTFDALQDESGRIQQIYQTTGVPESFILDHEGKIVKRFIGAVNWDQAAHRELFRRLLAAAGSSIE